MGWEPLNICEMLWLWNKCVNKSEQRLNGKILYICMYVCKWFYVDTPEVERWGEVYWFWTINWSFLFRSILKHDSRYSRCGTKQHYNHIVFLKKQFLTTNLLCTGTSVPQRWTKRYASYALLLNKLWFKECALPVSLVICFGRMIIVKTCVWFTENILLHICNCTWHVNTQIDQTESS